ncbi:mid1-interacting protein 1-like [Anoplophora glabripennis]|uniref:mid1-interacting protein 1-like n=1 Tax=Anoplophora glabripennis TaxID=217634 RepID=UPI0008753B25|nr:mid1-interacting protein 1-like [Anoplophora glabripennis]
MDLALSDTLTNMNSYPENITTSLENSRNCLRRIARNDDTEFSHQSILNVMEKFVKTVNQMDETILVPCRLMDQKVGDEHDPACIRYSKIKPPQSVHELFSSTDLFEIYNMLNGVKDGLLWGQTQDQQGTVSTVPKMILTTSLTKGHFRRPSTVSVTSTNSSSSTMSDTDSESGSNENDSGIEEPSVQEEGKVDRVAHNFRTHLHGLTSSLRQMTEAAQYLTWRYQYDIGGPV